MDTPLTLEHAPEAILSLARHRSAGAVPVIAITGPVGSGKSTLASRLGGVVLATDDYLPDYADLPEHERDLPERACLHELAEHLLALRRGEPALVPVWSFERHARVGARLVRPADPVVVEGIHALDARVAPIAHVRVFVEAPADLRWARWEAIERAGLRGFGVERARAHFDSIAEPTFAARADRYRAAADLVVLNA